MSKQTFYVTTPLYYVNAKPHLGTLYSTLLADVAARWQRFAGKNVFFLTGTDEHGQKMADSAADAGLSPQQFVDRMVPVFQEVWKQYGISYSHFIRTTDSSHKQTVIYWIERLKKQGDIYKDSYEGLYCVPCETFVTSEHAVKEGAASLCPSCHRSIDILSEKNYFFRLSAYADKLLAFYKQNPSFITPKERLNEVISFVRGGLKDLSLSRKSVGWGIPFPGDSEHTVYVWCDALMNYVSALGYLRFGEKSAPLFQTFWPAHMQVMAKDIVKFHAVYLPAFLMAAGVEPAKQLLVHGYILVDDDKMSKSKGNVFDPVVLAKDFGVDPVRYYLTRYMVPTHDGNFSLEGLARRVGADLANSLGNLLQRSASLALKYGFTESHPVSKWSDASLALRAQCAEVLNAYEREMNDAQFHNALAQVWKFIGKVNAYFHTQKPWLLAKENVSQFKEVIAATCQSLYVVAHLIAPVMPYKSKQLLAALGHTVKASKESLWENKWNVMCTLFVPREPLFVRPEIRKTEQMADIQEAKQTTVHSKEEKVVSTDHIAADAVITIEDVAKVELVVGEICVCESLEKSQKLYRLEVDMGAYGKRQVIAGIAQYFSCEDIQGKKAVFVANLKPRKMMGLESQGMILCARDGEKLTIITVDTSITNGTRLS